MRKKLAKKLQAKKEAIEKGFRYFLLKKTIFPSEKGLYRLLAIHMSFMYYTATFRE